LERARGEVINSWQPNALRGVSDFDTTHQINANWIIEMPFGRGKLIGKDAHGFSEAVIGGWELTGLARWTSGFPVNISNGATWPTNWQLGVRRRSSVLQRPAYEKRGWLVNLFPDPREPQESMRFVTTSLERAGCAT